MGMARRMRRWTLNVLEWPPYAVVLGLALMFSTLSLSACDGQAPGVPTAASSSSAQGASSSATTAGAAEAALAYSKAVAMGDLALAKANFDPRHRGVLDVIALSATKQGDGRAELQPGDVRISDNQGVVTLTGVMCSPFSPAGSQCTSNSDPNAMSPIFTVPVVKIEGRWYATLPSEISAPSLTASSQVRTSAR